MPALKQPKKPYGLQGHTEERVEQIAATIRAGTFKYGVTLKAFQAKWELSAHRVAELSTLAQKKVAAEQAEDHVRLRAKGFGLMERIADESIAAADEDPENASTHRGVALKAVDTLLVRSGAAVVQTQKVHVTGGLEQLTDEQLEEREREVLARIAARERGGK